MKDAEKDITVSLAELCLKHRKAGMEEAEKEWIVRLNGCKDACQLSIKDSRQLGIKEVVKWVNENVGYNGMTTLDEKWQAKLKEWGVG